MGNCITAALLFVMVTYDVRLTAVEILDAHDGDYSRLGSAVVNVNVESQISMRCFTASGKTLF